MRRGPQSELTENTSLTSKIDSRVVFLTHYIPPYQVQVLKAIAERVRDFKVLLSTPIEPNRDFELDWGGLDVTVQRTITFRRRWRHRGQNTALQFDDPLYVHLPIDTTKQLKRFCPDVVMSLELGARSLGAVRYGQLTGCPSILCTYMSEHTETHRGLLRERVRRYLVRKADAITYNGPSCRNYLRSIGAVDDQLYRLSYAADDRTVFKGAVERDDIATRSRLLYVGQLSERKGILPMLQQVSDFCRERPDRSIELRLAGQGPLRDQVADFAVPNNLSVRLLGNIPPSNLADEMANCGATIASTLADEWLLVVNEALHAGLPVIGSRYAQAVTTLINDGENGWVYDPVNPASLHAALDQYFSMDSGEASQLWERCQASIRHCTPPWAASEAVQAIADLTASRASAAGPSASHEASS